MQMSTGSDWLTVATVPLGYLAGRYMESLRGMAKNVYGRTRKEIDAYVRGERQWWQG